MGFRLGCFGNFQLFQLSAAALGHFGGGSAHQVAVNIILQLGRLFHIGIMLFLQALVRCFALGQVGGVVAAVGGDGFAAQLPDTGTDRIQEVAVMADHQHCAAVGFQIGFQPVHRFQIQMVGGFVQNQNVRAFQQQAGQAQAGLLAAGKHPGLFLPGICREAHAVEHLFDLGIHIIGIHGIDHCVAGCDLIRNSRVVVVSCQLLLQGLQLRHGVKRRLERKAHGFVNVFLRVKMTRLFQVAAGCPRRKGSVTGIGQAFAAQHTQERGFAGAVCTNNTNAVAAFHTGCYMF